MAEGSKTVTQAVRILQSLSLDGPAGVSEIARRLGIARSVAHRLIVSLSQGGLITRTGTTWRLGAGLIGLAARVNFELTEHMRPYLDMLADALAETAVVAIPVGESAVALDQAIPAGRAVQVNYRRGTRHPLNKGAHGLAILAHMSAESDGVLANVRRNGYARTENELEASITGLAAPVFDSLGEVVASIGIVAPTQRFPQNADTFVVDIAHQASFTLEMDHSRARRIAP